MSIFNLFKKKTNNDAICGGVVKDYYLDDYSDNINSNNITSFEYECGDYYLKCFIDNNQLHIISHGGNIERSEVVKFEVDYYSKNNDLLDKLNNIIKENELYKNNGHIHEVGGLPPGLGDKLDIVYDSGEKIHKSSNQYPHIEDKVALEIYNLFRDNAKENGYNY